MLQQSKVIIFDTTTLEKLSGIVKRITFHSPETGWTVLKINPFDNPIKEIPVTIHQSKVFAGATMDFYGNWTRHPKFGEQFKALKAVERQPATANALEKYLGSGLITGVGPVTAKAIVDYFGKDTLEVFDTKIERLDEVPKIGKKKLEMIAKAWDEHKEIKDVMMFLQNYDVSTLFAVKIYKTYGKEAIKIVSDNPYKLAQDIYGIGFFSADNVARKMGIDLTSEKRIMAAIDHVLAASREEGHCYLTKEQIIEQVNELLQLAIDEQISFLLDKMEKEDRLKVRLFPTDEKLTKCYYDHSLYFDEEYIAKKIQELAKQSVVVDVQRVEKWIHLFCQKKGILLSDEQQQAIAGVVKHGISVLTGGPGCGKTTTTKVLVQLLLAMQKKVLLCAPTGRASQRMTEVIGIQAKTVHRLLEWQPAQGGFKKNDKDPLQTDFLIIDESSMLDVHLAAALLRAVSSRTKVLFIGDADQLPAIGAGNVFGDIIASGIIPVFTLTKIFRQAQESYIIRYAHEVNKGKIPDIASPTAKPDIWNQGVDCLFLDSEEATMDQLKFIKKIKSITGNIPTNPLQLHNEGSEEYQFVIPDKFKHVDIEKLAETKTHIEELKEVLRKIHPHSTLHYGMNASETIKRLYSQTISKYLGKNVEIQILSPMVRGSLGTVSLNKLIQETVNPPRQGVFQIQLGDRIFRVGDRVIQRRNNYDLQVFNGDIGRITAINNEDMKISVQYGVGNDVRIVTYEKESLSEIDLAYAISIHKSQGSEFQAVIIPITTQHFNMLFRNLLYTGLTRGKKLVVFVGSRKALAMAVKHQKSLIRQTALKVLLKAVIKEESIVKVSLDKRK